MSSKPIPATRASTRIKTAAKTAATRATKPATKAASRKPLVNKDNFDDTPASSSKAQPKPASGRKAGKQPGAPSEADHEPIKAYLRIRPKLGDERLESTPYLTHISDTTVRMTDPQDSQNSRSRFRSSAVPPSSTYTFSHVFPPETTQSDFFTKTTLPLVCDVLQGQNGLLFTYGVTNSGKTYTVQGGTHEGTAGILPRALDVIFNSTEGLQGDGRFRPVRLCGIEPTDPNESRLPQISTEPALVKVLGQQLESTSDPEFDIDPTSVIVDRNYEYTIWLSYAEVYNEKIYDLLASVKEESAIKVNPGASSGKSILLSRQALPLRPSPPSDSDDPEVTGKYISGLRQFRVRSSSQAKALVKLGQLHRRVFGTLANRESSRSHSMVVIKVVRGHGGEADTPSSLQVSRLTLVDLAGSERTKHTHTTGERLKEAGNINKSLMVLGQCMEVMRMNQRKLATSLSQEGSGADGRMDTKEIKKLLAIVPFRHSKLTEALMDYFIGDGRAVMIVNVNPYDTGYDENSHVMKFSALAREVYISSAAAPMQRVPVAVGPGNLTGKEIKGLGPLTLKDPAIAPFPYSRKVTLSMEGSGYSSKPNQPVLEVVEEDEPPEEHDQEGEDDISGHLVEMLFDEIEDLRMQLLESEMRSATIEADIREEVMREMEERMSSIEQMYARRLMSELEQNELKNDAKIDMLHESGLFGSSKRVHQNAAASSKEEEGDVKMSLADNIYSDGYASEAADSSEYGEGIANLKQSKIYEIPSEDDDNNHPDDSIVILPIGKVHRNLQFIDAEAEAENNAVKKKKRQLGKKAISTEDEIRKTAYAVEKQTENARGIRRLHV